MKKLITIVLTLVMVFSMAACGGSEDGESGQQAGAPITVISREDGSGTRGAFTELMGITVDDVDHTTQMAEI
ncbi:MAG: phosphate ABC transporter substrate-binding protein, partial [Firmicutes bacterium]|nr:phosphate ABC transporter substrate-binding protein [Bacillota bacterium]